MDVPVVAPQTTDAGLRFGFDEAMFARWWHALPTDDQNGFKDYKGDVQLARFVCAYDYLKNRQQTPKMVAIAHGYAAVFGIDPGSYVARVRGSAAFEHRAAQFLIESIESATLRNAKANATPKISRLLDKILDDGLAAEAKPTRRVKSLDAALRFLRMMQKEGMGALEAPEEEPPKPVAKFTGKTIDANEVVLDMAGGAPAEEPPPEE